MTSKQPLIFRVFIVPILLLSLILCLSYSPVLAAPSAQDNPDDFQMAPQAVDACMPDISSMEAYWPLNDIEGANIFSELVSNNRATCPGGSCPTKEVTGKVSGSFNFNGIDRVSVPGSDDWTWSRTGNFSFEVWAKLNGTCTAGRQVFIGKYRKGEVSPGVTDYSNWWLGCHTDSTAWFQLRSSINEVVDLHGGPALSDGQWHHLVAVRDNASDTNRLFVDGIQVDSQEHNYTGDFSSDALINIGWYDAAPDWYYLNGSLDEVAMYDSALTESQVAAHYNDGLGQSYCRDLPAATDDASDLLKTDEDTLLVIEADTLLANDTAIDPGSVKTITEVNPITAEGGTLSGLGPLTYTPAENYNGDFKFQYTFSDGLGGSASATATLVVNPVNDVPVVTDPGEQNSFKGQVISLKVTATDADADDPAPNTGVLTFSAENLPPDLSIDASTGDITGTFAVGAARATPYQVKVTVADNNTPSPASSFVEFDWYVTNQAPEVDNPGDQVKSEGAEVSLQIVAREHDGDDLSFSATGLPEGLSINPVTGTITGIISYNASEQVPGGVYQVEVVVSDDYTPPASRSIQFEWKVTTTNRAPEVTNPGARANNIGDIVSLQIEAVDPDGDTNLSFQADDLPPGLTIHPINGLISGTISNSADPSKPYTVQITVSDGDLSTTVEFIWKIGKHNIFIPSVLRDIMVVQ